MLQTRVAQSIPVTMPQRTSVLVCPRSSRKRSFGLNLSSFMSRTMALSTLACSPAALLTVAASNIVTTAKATARTHSGEPNPHVYPMPAASPQTEAEWLEAAGL